MGTEKGRAAGGFSLIELLIVVAIILIIAAIAIPNLLRARRTANEASATANMRTIASSQLLYRSLWANFTTLTGLSQDSLVDGVLGSGAKSGYTFISAPGGNTSLQFTAISAPTVSTGTIATGTRSYYVDETQVLRFSIGSVADSTSAPIGN